MTIEAADPTNPPVIHAAPDVGGRGGVIVAPAGTALTLRDIIIEGANGDPAIDAFNAESVTLDGVTMRDNSGPATLEAPLRTLIEGSTFSHNSTSDTGAVDVALSTASVQIRDSVFDHNHSGDDGGAVSLLGALQDVQIDASSFLHNSAQDGGAIAMLNDAGSVLTVSNSTFDGDVADRGAALLVDENSDVQPHVLIECGPRPRSLN